MIVFFPTYATRPAAGGPWRAVVAGMVTRPLPTPSRRRTMALAVLKRLLDLDDAQLESPVFQRRAEAFLFQRVAGQPVHGGRRVPHMPQSRHLVQRLPGPLPIARDLSQA